MLIGGVQVLLGGLLVLLGVLVLPRKLIYGMQLAFNLTKSIERENSKYFKGRLLNPNFKVFRIKQTMRLISSTHLIILTRINIEKKNRN